MEMEITERDVAFLDHILRHLLEHGQIGTANGVSEEDVKALGMTLSEFERCRILLVEYGGAVVGGSTVTGCGEIMAKVVQTRHYLDSHYFTRVRARQQEDKAIRRSQIKSGKWSTPTAIAAMLTALATAISAVVASLALNR